MNPNEPASYLRRVLLVVSGMSPQILTETLWALTQSRHPGFIPTEIRMLTTAGGYRNARKRLLEEGHFARFCNEYEVQPPCFDVDQIEIIRDSLGLPLEDIRTPEENSAAADHITEIIRQYTLDDHCALHVSIAGGRKTMGYYAGYALSLFAREQDRLSHVLVSEDFENLADFYYPTRASQLINAHGNRVLDAHDACVTLAQIPFVRLRDEVPAALLQGQASFSQAIAVAQRINAPVSLRIDLKKSQVIAAGEHIQLPPILLAFYAWLTDRSLRGEEGVSVQDLVAPNKILANEFVSVFLRLIDENRDVERTLDSLKDGISREWFDEKKSRINRQLSDTLGKTLAKNYQINGTGRRGLTRYSLMLEAEHIEWLE